ncbi:phosphate ABC transporter permease subunit PstC [Phototrophicus methaneseepsis]|uniref:Phosphate transport system permease protein n=1 Tax=Phototrophicus methaneseepsis TaxID=2710758 RepID=A0A7S8EAZ1_9CHLR|nr:phosphate ABC transporter permease subunit PstC [Phototrophicus methaneseepsis]QPC83582.1 phosphate ABC transporter permease subunit PstC [Phototrophicus methaneseepsis]
MAPVGKDTGPRKRLVARALGEDRPKKLDLRSKPRFHERIIYGFLLACGLLSILTTAGIIVVLLNEAVSFFTRQQWALTNKSVYEEVSADATTFTTSATGSELEDGGVIRIGQEQLLVERYERNVVTVAITGTGAGFSAFCEGNAAIVDASRAITESETEACAANDIEPIPFRIGTDALAIVVNPENTMVNDATLQELALIFGEAETWADVRDEWPDQPIQRFIPGTDSGTFDYFGEAIYGEEVDRLLASEPVTSEDDEQLARGVRQNPYAVAFFGYSYYANNSESLKVLDIEGITPALETVEDGSYPLSRPLYIYTDPDYMRERSEVATFIEFYLTHVDEEIIDVGYFPASDDTLTEAKFLWLETMGQPVPESVDDDTTLLPDVDLYSENGTIVVTGSSTVAPVTRRIGTRFQEGGFLPRVFVQRGYNDTAAVEHRPGQGIESEERPTLVEFFTNTQWIPATGEFGVLPLINATLITSAIAMIVALPLGLGAAIYLSEYAKPNVRKTLKPILEILAGIPTVVYGYFALTFMTPLLRLIFGDQVQIYNMLSAGIVVGILIIPLVTSMSEDALHAVPDALREASYGLGANRLETSIKVVVPAALSGILAAFIVAISRAIGETMVVAIAAGSGPNFTFNIFEGAETMTGHIARISGGDLSYDSIDYNSIFAIGLTLFVMTLLLNVISRAITNRFREEY